MQYSELGVGNLSSGQPDLNHGVASDEVLVHKVAISLVK